MVFTQVSESGVHRPHVSGIHGRDSDGAYSIVLAGGYEDDVVIWPSLQPLQILFSCSSSKPAYTRTSPNSFSTAKVYGRHVFVICVVLGRTRVHCPLARREEFSLWPGSLWMVYIVKPSWSLFLSGSPIVVDMIEIKEKWLYFASSVRCSWLFQAVMSRPRLAAGTSDATYASCHMNIHLCCTFFYLCRTMATSSCTLAVAAETCPATNERRNSRVTRSLPRWTGDWRGRNKLWMEEWMDVGWQGVLHMGISTVVQKGVQGLSYTLLVPRALARNCAAPLDDKDGAVADKWRNGKPVRVVSESLLSSRWQDLLRDKSADQCRVDIPRVHAISIFPYTVFIRLNAALEYAPHLGAKTSISAGLVAFGV